MHDILSAERGRDRESLLSIAKNQSVLATVEVKKLRGRKEGGGTREKGCSNLKCQVWPMVTKRHYFG